jgi:hypothetical protein
MFGSRNHEQTYEPRVAISTRYVSYIGVKVSQQFETGWGVVVVCCITAYPHSHSVTRSPPEPDTIYPTKSQPFSIIWRITLTLWSICIGFCNLRGTLSRAFTSLPPGSFPPTSKLTRAPGTVVSNGTASPSSSSSLPPPQAHAQQVPATPAVLARAAPVTGALASSMECNPFPATLWIS